MKAKEEAELKAKREVELKAKREVELNTKERMNVLLEIEKHTGTIPRVSSISWDTFGVKLENNRVVGLGLYECGLKTLPESITKLTSLKVLDLQGNSITTLPESIGNLKSLEYLNLMSNDLSTLPESIKTLEKRGVAIYK